MDGIVIEALKDQTGRSLSQVVQGTAELHVRPMELNPLFGHLMQQRQVRCFVL